jgi:hypothetical protein
MADIPNSRRIVRARPLPPRRREIRDLLDRHDDGAAVVDASYGDTLRRLLPRRLSALTRRPR